MSTEKSISSTPIRIRKIAYWTTTIILIVGMLAGGASQLFRVDYQIQLFEHLGYPIFLMSIIGGSKILGAIILLIPGIPRIKMAVYSGIVFVTISAVISHSMVGDYGMVISPLFTTILAVISCWLNPGIVFAKIDKTK